jgi:NAD+ kinase
MTKYEKIGYVAGSSEICQQSLQDLVSRYNLVDAAKQPPDYCDALIVLGGDGVMLKALHTYMEAKVPLFGMNRGSVGFLMNNYSVDNLYQRINQSRRLNITPLIMTAKQAGGKEFSALAINEVSLLREINQSAKIRISINHKEKMECLVCDGVLVSTPAGSTAYNFAAYGPIIPMNAKILALTPISPFRPRRWGGALLPHDSIIKFDILEAEKRPVSAVADFTEVRDVIEVEIKECPEKSMTLLFDRNHSFEERVLTEQFSQ